MVEHRRLAILLSTFNGETFLSEQLDSILQQSFTDFIIVARDDGSVDRTRGILTQYAAEHAGRFFILPDEAPTWEPRPVLQHSCNMFLSTKANWV